jgi:hypothetical protein
MKTQPQSSTLAHQAARVSWVCPIITVLLVTLGRQMGSPMVIDLISLGLIIIGLAAGILALLGIPKFGWKGIIASASAGIMINGFLIFIFLTNFLGARAKAP